MSFIMELVSSVGSLTKQFKRRSRIIAPALVSSFQLANVTRRMACVRKVLRVVHSPVRGKKLNKVIALFTSSWLRSFILKLIVKGEPLTLHLCLF